MKRRGSQRVRFTVERRMAWYRNAGGYTGYWSSEPTISGRGARTLAELRRELVRGWRQAHGAIVKPTGRPRRNP